MVSRPLTTIQGANTDTHTHTHKHTHTQTHTHLKKKKDLPKPPLDVFWGPEASTNGWLSIMLLELITTRPRQSSVKFVWLVPFRDHQYPPHSPEKDASSASGGRLPEEPSGDPSICRHLRNSSKIDASSSRWTERDSVRCLLCLERISFYLCSIKIRHSKL